MPASPKLLYLGFAFPPGVAGRFPEAQPAGHLVETSLVTALRPWFEIRSVGVSWIRVDRVLPGDASPGLPHALQLLDKWPELFHRWNSVRRLRNQYLAWLRGGWQPDAILMWNFSPVYNGFIRWLDRQGEPPRRVLIMADSVNLQRKFPWGRRLRHRFKPFIWPDSDMVRYIEACVAVSRDTEQFFAARRVPWLWLPSGCDPARALRPEGRPASAGPIAFGYFGSLAAYSGLPALVRVFLSRSRKSELHVCGYGKTKEEIASLCRQHPHLHFHGPRTPDQCLQFAQGCDVLINPRPLMQGNENNIPSKLFEYALSGRAILTTRMSGVGHILGEHALYFDEHDFDASLDVALETIANLPRPELHRRGLRVQERLLENFSWAQQGRRLAGFLSEIIAGRGSGQAQVLNRLKTAHPGVAERAGHSAGCTATSG